jgi:hypothetical protein
VIVFAGAAIFCRCAFFLGLPNLDGVFIQVAGFARSDGTMTTIDLTRRLFDNYVSA